jgi:hypothetical protein
VYLIRNRKVLAVALVVALAACGGSSILKSFRVALASSGPLVNSLASSGAIPQSKVTAIIADFDAGAQCGLTLQNDFAAVPKDISEREQASRKLNASVKGLKCFRVVIDRQNFAAHPRIQQAANIAEGILASLVVFYSDDGPMRASAEGKATVSARNEKDLEARLKSQVEALKAAMKP